MFQDIIEPISEQQPTGEYLKDNRQLYRGYRNSFNVAQSSFRQLVETPDALEDAQAVTLNTDNWLNLRDECFKCLTQHSKDVEIYSWFTMAQLFTSEPYDNLAAALSTFEEVINKYWEELQPTLPEKKQKGNDEAEKAKQVIEHRVKPLLQLVGDTADSGLLYMPLQMLPLVGDIDFSKFYSAEKNGTLAQLKEEANSFFSSEQMEISSKLISLDRALNSIASLDKTISEKCFTAGVHPISFKFVKESIERLISAIRYLVGDSFTHWPLDTVEEIAATEESTSQEVVSEHPAASKKVDSTMVAESKPVVMESVSANQAGVALNVSSAIGNREQALSELQKIADYFLITEPHSPIYLLLKRAIRWGGMSLPELLEELVGDNSSVHQRIEQMAGLESAQHVASINTPVKPDFSPQKIVAEVKETEQEPQSSTSTKEEAGGGLSDIEW